MTIHGWDTSHYDGRLTRDHMAKARAEGIAFLHSKVGEGLTDTEGTYDDTALAGARDAGIEFLGAYFVPRTLDSAAQVDLWRRQLDAGEPWLYDWPGRYAVVDLERWPYDNVSAGKGIDCAKRLRDRLGWQVLLYASHGQYGDSLTGWDGPLINADYTSRPAAGFAAMYPGDDWQPWHGTWRGGWAPYSGREPTFLQYTSSATIAGLSTCDANAYRGSLAQLRALITRGGSDTMQWDDQGAKAKSGQATPDPILVDLFAGEQSDSSLYVPGVKTFRQAQLRRMEDGITALKAAADADTVRDAAALAAVQALAAGGTSLDTAAVVTAVNGVRDEARAAYAALHEENTSLRAELAAAHAELAQLRAAAAAAAHAQADALGEQG